jgi:choline dehydrogenase-like flavoprotein
VDANCRVHGMDNLYIAGSSIFPTVGNDMPTINIVALAHRLADHIKLMMSLDLSADTERPKVGSAQREIRAVSSEAYGKIETNDAV